MGLDMYAFSTDVSNLVDPEAQTDLEFHNKENVHELFYWCKFNHLHGWMFALYQAKGGKDDQFNCNTVRLTLEDLDKLNTDAKEGKLTHCSGYFFGSDQLYDGDMESIDIFLRKAKKLLSEGKVVFYDSWW